MKWLLCAVQELGINKVAHQARLQQALKIVTGKRTTQHHFEVVSTNDNSTAPASITVNIIPSPTITDSDTIV